MEVKIMKIKELEVLVIKKNIKNWYISVLPPEGKIRVSVPSDVPDELTKAFVIGKYDRIQKHVKAFQKQERQNRREYVSGESHYLRGKRYLMRVIPAKRPKMEIKNKKYIYYYVPENYTKEQRQRYYEKWLRKELRKDLEVLVPKWENIMNLKANEIGIKKMKTRWGSCNPKAKRIWLNLELVKKTQKHLEYIIVHELTHFIESKHNKTFKKIMSKYMPLWEIYKRELNEFIL